VSDAPARQTPRSQSLDLEFVEPSTLRFGNRDLRVGGVVYRFLQALFSVTNREQSLAVLEKAVWGHPVNRNTLWSACRRARCVLIELKHPLRVSIRGDQIALV
jgi:hypothetical protein